MDFNLKLPGSINLLVIWVIFMAVSCTSQKILEQDPVDLLLLGDTGFGESYQEKLATHGKENILESRDYYSAFEKLASLCQNAETVVLNLETPLYTPDSPSPYENLKSSIHWCDTLQAIEVLKKLKVDAVSMANNHSLDYGREGLLNSIKVLNHNGIQCFGAGINDDRASRPFVFSVPVDTATKKIYILGGFEYRVKYDTLYHFYADRKTSGVIELDSIIFSLYINYIKTHDPDAFVIIFPHWGSNYSWRSKNQANMGRYWIDAGADLVVGHGAHVYQEIERYKGKWILYSIGNFVFNSSGRYQEKGVSPYSVAVTVDFDEKNPRIALYPILSDNLLTGFQPRLLENKEFRSATKEILNASGLPRKMYKLKKDCIELTSSY